MTDLDERNKKIHALFESYAADFELTFEDDAWARLERYFHPDVAYTREGIDRTRTAGRRGSDHRGARNIDLQR